MGLCAMKHDPAALFRDYFNNFLTVACFAEYYELTPEEAENVITIGRKLHEEQATN